MSQLFSSLRNFIVFSFVFFSFSAEILAQDYAPGYRTTQRPREMVQQVQPQRQVGFFERIFGRREELAPQRELYVRTPQSPYSRQYDPSLSRDKLIDSVTGLPLDPRYTAKKKDTNSYSSKAAAINSSGLYCVRSCDGYFFPISNPSKLTGEVSSQQEVCSSLCPNASMEVYRGSNIEDAVGPNRKSYSAHPKSYAYREKIDNSCSCKGDRVGGLATLPFTRDFTLRTGDIVLMDDGAHQFKGGGSYPYKPRDFAMLTKGTSRLSPDLREMLEAKNVGFGVVANTQVASNQIPVGDSSLDLNNLVSSKSVRIIDILAPLKERPKMLVDIIQRRKVAQNF